MSTPGQPHAAGNYPNQTGAAANPYAAVPSGFPTTNYPGSAELPAGPVRPRTVDIAFGCWILTTVISLIGLVLNLNSQVWDDAIAAGVRSSGETRVDVQSLVNVSKAILIVVFLISIAVYLFFAFKMRAGRNWARITLTVFGAFTIISTLTSATGSVTVNSQTYSAGSQGPSWITAVVVLAAIIAMYVGESNKYFTDSKAYRQRLKG